MLSALSAVFALVPPYAAPWLGEKRACGVQPLTHPHLLSCFLPLFPFALLLTQHRRTRCGRPVSPAPSLSALFALVPPPAAPWSGDRRACGAQLLSLSSFFLLSPTPLSLCITFNPPSQSSLRSPRLACPFALCACCCALAR